ncbi:histidine kinase [Arthrobacter sp. AB6]|uniref:sensor histidine kinase n=1 Tax=Arthrobacter sp. AB6 TaxID=2962570 RepID=UPI002881A506|nr:histidine kinase [Arthrobacter sp. AB6]MDT0196678.1 histidine kinase [Arthrobacter sp. AB6]
MGLNDAPGDLVVAMLGFLVLGLTATAAYLLIKRHRVQQSAYGSASPTLDSIMALLPYFRTALEPGKSARLASRVARTLKLDVVAIADLKGIVGSHNLTAEQLHRVGAIVRRQQTTDRNQMHRHRGTSADDTNCGDPHCPQTTYAVINIHVEGRLAGTICALDASLDADRERALLHVGGLIEAQLGLQELKQARMLLEEAEADSLRAQISPHFVYNALNVIATYIATDPARARKLVIEFANFTRYSFRKAGRFTSLADELRAIESYILLQEARYGPRLHVTLQISPDSLSTSIPYLSLQPLVENAIRHGIESAEGDGHIRIKAHEEGALTIVSIEDDGAGMDPERLGAALAGSLDGHHVGLRNVDTRMRQAYGDQFHLLIDTAPGEGTLITLRIPKLNKDLEG